MKKQNIKTPLIFRIGLVVVCLLLCSVYATSGLYAKYVTQASSYDSARVARFAFSDDLSEQSINLPLVMAPGDVDHTEITIENDGEVAIRYTVSVKNLTENLPIENQVIKSGTLQRGEDSTFEWDIEWPLSQSSIESAGKMDILKIVVTVEQVD